MTDSQDIIDFFHTLVDDELDSVYVATLLNQADAVIRHLRPWEILKALDTSKTRVEGEDFDSTKALPTDFDRPHLLYVGTLQRPPLKRVRLEEKQMFLNTAGLYLINYKNSTFSISSATWAGTIYQHYFYKPPVLVGGTVAPVNPVFPSDFWPLWAYAMAEIQSGGTDQDERSLQAVPQWLRTQSKLWEAMTNWDADLKDEGNVYRPGSDESLPPLDLGLLGH